LGGIVDSGGSMTVTYSDVQDGVLPGMGNISIAPLLANAGPNDLNLLSDSDCIDSGSSAAIPAGIFSDVDGNPLAVVDPVKTNTGITVSIAAVDIGAYEFIPGASSLQIIGDHNCDGIVNELDFAFMALPWLETN